MSVVTIEGFNDQIANLGKGWTWFSTGGGAAYDTSNQRHGSGCGYTSASNNRHWQYAIPNAFQDDELVVGVAVRWTSGGGGGRTLAFWSANSGEQNGILHVWLRFNSDQSVDVMRGTSTVIASNVAGFVIDSYDYWEMYVKLAGSGAGAIEVHKNGTQVYQNLAVTTRDSGADTVFNMVELVAAGTTIIYFDDFYLLRKDGSGLEDFLGDVQVVTLYPDGEGNRVDWTATGSPGGGNPFNYVDETGLPNTTDYIEDSNVNDVHQFTMTNLPVSGTVFAVAANHYTSKSDTIDVRKFSTAGRVGGSNFDGATEFTLSTSWEAFIDVMEQRPAGGDWTTSDVNGMELGVKLTT